MFRVFGLVLYVCLCGDAFASMVSHANSLAKSTPYTGDMKYFGAKSYGCELVSSSADYEYSDGDIIQAIDSDMYAYKCVDVSGTVNDKWERIDTRYCADSPIKNVKMNHTKICVYQGGAEKKCKIQGEYFDNSKWEAYKNGCVRVECIGDAFLNKEGACQERKCGDSPEGTVLENQECASNVITDSNAVFCSKTCTYRENPNRMVWVNLISECKQNYKPSDDGKSCVRVAVRYKPREQPNVDGGEFVQITDNDIVETEVENVETVPPVVVNKSPCEQGADGWILFEGVCITNTQHQQILSQREAARMSVLISQIDNSVSQLETIGSRFDVSVWKNKDGKFNTARLASDGVAGVGLGTAGGLITSSMVKKNQIEKGFEDIKCTIGDQSVADWGDEFMVGMQ